MVECKYRGGGVGYSKVTLSIKNKNIDKNDLGQNISKLLKKILNTYIYDKSLKQQITHVKDKR